VDLFGQTVSKRARLHSHPDAIEFPFVVLLCSLDGPIRLVSTLCIGITLLPPFFTPLRFPAESDDPALNPPDRLVAVRIPSGKVGLSSIFGSAEVREKNELMNEAACCIIILGKNVFEFGSGYEGAEAFCWRT
jgi:hypothetical protein